MDADERQMKGKRLGVRGWENQSPVPNPLGWVAKWGGKLIQVCARDGFLAHTFFFRYISEVCRGEKFFARTILRFLSAYTMVLFIIMEK